MAFRNVIWFHYRNTQTRIRFTEHAANKASASANCTLSPMVVVSIVFMAENIGRFYRKSLA